jgi:hypothetical protein
MSRTASHWTRTTTTSSDISLRCPNQPGRTSRNSSIEFPIAFLLQILVDPCCFFPGLVFLWIEAMHIRQVVVLLLAWSSCILASPTPFQKRAFSVNQPDRGSGFEDGPLDLRRAYLKHGIDLPPGLVVKRQAPAPIAARAAPQPTATGSTIAISDKNDLEYLSPVNIGGVMMQMDFDTGSSDL